MNGLYQNVSEINRVIQRVDLSNFGSQVTLILCRNKSAGGLRFYRALIE